MIPAAARKDNVVISGNLAVKVRRLTLSPAAASMLFSLTGTTSSIADTFATTLQHDHPSMTAHWQ
jgi:hypothetical protein